MRTNPRPNPLTMHGVNGLSVCLHEIGDQNVNAHVCSRYIGIQNCVEVHRHNHLQASRAQCSSVEYGTGLSVHMQHHLCNHLMNNYSPPSQTSHANVRYSTHTDGVQVASCGNIK